MKIVPVFILFLLVFATIGCKEKTEQTLDAESREVAEITLDRSRGDTIIETGQGKVVTRGGEKGGGEIIVEDEQSGVTHKFKSGATDGSVTVTDGKGGVSTYGTGVDVRASDLDIPFYPGGEITFGIKSRGGEAGGATRAVLSTTDPYEKPRGFYASAAPGSAYHHDTQSESGRMDMWTWRGDGFQYSVVVNQASAGGAVSITLEKLRIQ